MPKKKVKNPFSGGLPQLDFPAGRVEETDPSETATFLIEQAKRASRGLPLDGTVRACAKLYPGTILPNTIRDALEEILLSKHPDRALLYLRLTGFLSVFLPEINALGELDDGEGEYKNLWDHTLQVVLQAPPRRHLRWAALLHDIGKPHTMRTNAKGEVHFLGHEIVGASIAAKLMKKLQFPPKDAALIRFLVLNHLRCAQYESTWTDSAVRRLGKELGNHFDELLELARADITTKRVARRENYLRLLDELRERARRIAEEDAKPPLLPSGLGNFIMEAFGLKEGPEVGRIRRTLEDLVRKGTLEAAREPQYYIDYLKGGGQCY